MPAGTQAPAWRPSATRDALQRRAQLLAAVRAFFAARGVLEVDTPVLVNAPVTDVHLHSARVQLDGEAGPARFLHTSPEYAMKRLLAAGSGDIYQVCHVVRGEERSRLHNPEFTLVEWYRVGWTLEQLMDEVAALVRTLAGADPASRPVERLTYAEAFEREFGSRPDSLDAPDLLALAARAGLALHAPALLTREDLLDLLVGAVVGPRLGKGRLTFVHHYPASQAALARLDPDMPGTALRFELYADGVELANGFDELASASEQRARFEADLAERRRRGLPAVPMDERLLAALEAGLPPCAGVALGFDRVLMLATGATHIGAVIPFATDEA